VISEDGTDPPETLIFLVAYGATGMAAYPPFAKMAGVADPTDPAVIHAHAMAVADLVLTPPALAPDATPLALQSRELAGRGESG
jgi:hypothetical protein